jgi:hypothetical protein
MTPAHLRTLAQVLGILLPWRTIGRLMDDPFEAHAVAAKLQTACRTASVEEREAVIIAESLASYVLGWRGRYGTLAVWTGKGTAILHLAMGGQGDDDVQRVPVGGELTDEAIAQLLRWALLIEMNS